MKTTLIAMNLVLAAGLAMLLTPSAAADVPDCPESIFAYDPVTGNPMVYNCNGWDNNCAYQGFYFESPGDVQAEFGVLDHGCDGICVIALNGYLACAFPDATEQDE